MRVAALCAGYGGLEMGLQLAGWDVELAWFAEIDRHAAQVMARHHPGVPNLGDLTEIVDPPKVDVVTAGFPCQPVSVAGKRKGTEDERWIIDDVCRVTRDAGADWLILENVGGLLTANGGDAMARVVSGLAALGFAAEWGCVRAADVGAPHGRQRWFCIAYADGDGHGQGQDARRLGRMDRQDAEGPRQRERSRTQPGNRSDAAAADADGQGPQGRSAVRQRGDERPARQDGVGVEWGPYTDAIRRWEYMSGRVAPDPTDDKRRLNPRFVEWMMGLPDGWVCDAVEGRSHQLKILGNGVVPQQAAYAIGALMGRIGWEQ